MNIEEQFVVAVCDINNKKLPDVLSEDDGSIIFFENELEAKDFLQSLYESRDLTLIPLKEDCITLMRVQ
tara:strand:+ start:420 stop:626 length:207 start_codon:yes stop_codon:yes gene_type:complete